MILRNILYNVIILQLHVSLELLIVKYVIFKNLPLVLMFSKKNYLLKDITALHAKNKKKLYKKTNKSFQVTSSHFSPKNLKLHKFQKTWIK